MCGPTRQADEGGKTLGARPCTKHRKGEVDCCRSSEIFFNSGGLTCSSKGLENKTKFNKKYSVSTQLHKLIENGGAFFS